MPTEELSENSNQLEIQIGTQKSCEHTLHSLFDVGHFVRKLNKNILKYWKSLKYVVRMPYDKNKAS